MSREEPKVTFDKKSLLVSVTGSRCGNIDSQSVDTILLYLILQQLKKKGTQRKRRKSVVRKK